MSRSVETLATGAANLQAYLRDIARHPRLSVDDERALGRRIRQLSDDVALSRLVESNLHHVVGYARRYAHLGVPLLALIHEGNLGLLEAARRVDPEKPAPLIAWAAWWIRQAIVARLADESRRVEALRADVACGLADGPDAGAANLSPAEVALLVARAAADAPRRWSARDAGGGSPVGGVLAQGIAPGFHDPELRGAFVGVLEDALTPLAPREREIVRLRYGLAGGEPRSAAEVGERLRLSRGRVRRLEARAVQSLRRHVALRGLLN